VGTIPGNGAVLLGVADAEKPNLLINKPDGSVEIEIYNSRTLLLYATDNSSIKDGQTHYQVTVNFADSRSVRVPVGQ